MARRPQATITHKAVIDQTSVADECQRKVPPLTPTVGADSPRPKKWRGHCQKQTHGATLEKRDKTAVSATVAQSRGRIRRSARPAGGFGLAGQKWLNDGRLNRSAFPSRSRNFGGALPATMPPISATATPAAAAAARNGASFCGATVQTIS